MRPTTQKIYFVRGSKSSKQVIKTFGTSFFDGQDDPRKNYFILLDYITCVNGQNPHNKYLIYLVF